MHTWIILTHKNYMKDPKVLIVIQEPDKTEIYINT